MKLLALLCLSFSLFGCATVDYTNVDNRHMVDISNTGWYFLNIVPIASGDPSMPNANNCSFFNETATLKNNIKMLDFAAAKYKAHSIKNIKSYWTDESIFFILLKRHVIHTSAELIIKK